MNAKNKEELT